MSARELEPGIVTDLKDRLTYGGYLCLGRLLSAQQPLSGRDGATPRHDEMLFIVQHQVAELWMKLMIHELEAAVRHVHADRLSENFKILARVKLIQKQLFEMWGVLETLTPSEYDAFRPSLGSSSGFQSAQFRELEYRLGIKDPRFLDFYEGGSEGHARLERALNEPSLWDEANAALKRAGFTTEGDGALKDSWLEIYRRPDEFFGLYQLAEKLVDLDDALAAWRHKHMLTVDRIIGMKKGTGGSEGVAYLASTLSKRAFPELWSLRTEL